MAKARGGVAIAMDKPSASLIVKVKLIELGFHFVRYASWCVVALFAYLSIKALAGKQTNASILVSLFLSKENNFGIPWIATLLSIVWAFSERTLRRRKTKYFQARVTALERSKDPNRTTSGLTEMGTTNPGDIS